MHMAEHKNRTIPVLLLAFLLLFSGCGNAVTTDNTPRVLLTACESGSRNVDIFDSEQWLRTEYVVYTDGKTERTDWYGSHQRQYIPRRKDGMLGDEELDYIRKAGTTLRKRESSASVGDYPSWEITFYGNGYGETFFGYIGDDSTLLKLTNSIKQAAFNPDLEETSIPKRQQT